MKKRAGFSLAELVVSMGIFVLIIGALVALFGTSIKAMVYGKAQEVAYAEASLVMNDLKTTLRYADKKEEITPSSDSTSLEYSGTMTIGNDPTNSNNIDRSYKRKIIWDNGNKQLKIYWTGFYPGKPDPTSNKDTYSEDKVVVFPSNEINSAFSEADYLKVYNRVLKNDSTDGTDAGDTVSGTPFPIFRAAYQDGYVINIVLPIKYRFENGYKVEVLRSRVTTKDIDFATNSESGGDDKKTASEIAEVLRQAMHDIIKDNKEALRTDFGTKYISQLTSASANGNLQSGNLNSSIATQSLVDYINEKLGKGDVIKNRSWLIVACDKDGNMVILPDKFARDIAYWKIFVAKNVQDNIDSSNNNSTFEVSAIANLAQNKGIYIIRSGYGFLTYCFTTVNQTAHKFGDTGGTLGYASGVTLNSQTIINNSTWRTSYIGLIGYSNYFDYWGNYIDDSGKDSGTYARIDYDGTGSEYTKTTNNGNYKYPPNMATGVKGT